MKLQDILEKRGILIDLKAEDKTALLSQMCRYIASLYDIKDPDGLITKVVERESAMSTGIGFGIAIPHARLDTVDQIYMIAARCADPIDFNAIDDNPVRLVFLLVSPANTSSDHTRALSALSKIMSYEEVRRELVKASNADAFLSSIIQAENKYVSS